MKFCIDGSWVDPVSTRTMPVLNPSTEQQIGIVALGSEDDVNIAVAAASAAFESCSTTNRAERQGLVREANDLCRCHK